MNVLRLPVRRRTAAAQRTCLTCLALSAFLILSLLTVAYRCLVPHQPAGSPVAGPRTQWYVSSSQWKADARTFLSILRFLAEPTGHPGPVLEPHTNDLAMTGAPTPSLA